MKRLDLPAGALDVRPNMKPPALRNVKRMQRLVLHIERAEAFGKPDAALESYYGELIRRLNKRGRKAGVVINPPSVSLTGKAV